MSSIEKAISKLGKKNDGRVEKSSNQSSQEFDSMGMGDRIIIDDNASFRQIEINPEQLNGFGKADHKISKQLVEEFRVIKRPILKNAFDKQADYIGMFILILFGLLIYYLSSQLKKGERPTFEEKKPRKV